MAAITGAWDGAREGWSIYDSPFAGHTLESWYQYKWSLYSGNAFADLSRATGLKRYPAIYRNTRLIYKHVAASVDFYAMTVYSGDLSTDGQPLPDGTLGAIPIDPQLGGNKELEDQLRVAIAELWSAWNWRQNMTLRPMYAAALGDILTELVDDIDRGMVYPSPVWPGHVKEIELDYVGNVKRYVLEFQVRHEIRKGVVESYTFRKEVDKEAYRYFKDDRPFDYFGDGVVVPNPYGFVPAVWDRHQQGWGERGIAATESTWQALQELNSLLSHGKDFQHKKFAAPVFLKGVTNTRGQVQAQLREPPVEGVDAKVEAAYREELATSYAFMRVPDTASLDELSFDIGQTLEMLQFIKDGILEENPEASFFRQLRDLNAATGPAIERLQMDGTARCKRARLGHDTGSVKIFQMSTSMAGYRANNGDWGRNLTTRQQRFKPYNLDTYKKGEMDFIIRDRPVVPMTESERIALIAQKESLQTESAMVEAGVEPALAKRIVEEKRQAAEMGAF